VSLIPGEAWPEEVTALLRAAGRGPLLSGERRGSGTLLDRTAIEGLLPHRGRSLLLDRVTLIDASPRLIAARYDLADAREVFGEHFPGRPLWPGTLQVEAIGQAGLLLMTRLTGEGMQSEADTHALTHILWARFARPVGPGGELEIVARVVEDGLFHLVVGQCLKEGAVTTVAVLGGL
jgi:3-hydroxyacyl-[acyl-carrier-protein] dehydratase